MFRMGLAAASSDASFPRNATAPSCSTSGTWNAYSLMKHCRASAHENGSISGAISSFDWSAASISSVRTQASIRSIASSATGVDSRTQYTNGSCVSGTIAGASTFGSTRRGQISSTARIADRIAGSALISVSAGPASSTGRAHTSVNARVRSWRKPWSPGSREARRDALDEQGARLGGILQHRNARWPHRPPRLADPVRAGSPRGCGAPQRKSGSAAAAPE